LIIMGVDPGIAATGYGIIKIEGRNEPDLLDYGVISTLSHEEHPKRLQYIYERILEVIERTGPDVIAIESLFHSQNLKALVDVSEAIGVITLAAARSDLTIQKFTPLKVKSAIVGVGRAKKKQVGLMIQNILNLDTPPKPHHASDALAVAICYKNLYL
jgi:crossover junction endodeoxyribonuclease RuvC